MKLWLAALTLAVVGCGAKTAKPDLSVQRPLPSKEPTAQIDPTAGFTEPSAPSKAGVLLRLVFKPGTTVERLLSGTMKVSTVPGKPSPPKEALQDVKIRMRYAIEIASVKDRRATLKMRSSGMDVDRKDTQGKWIPPQKVGEITMDERGLVYDDLNGLVSGATGVGLIPFPKGPVAEGSTWSRRYERSMAPFGLVRITENYTYKGVVTEDNLKLHRIDFTAIGSLPNFTMSGSYYYRQTDCILQRAEFSQTATLEVPDTPEHKGVGVAKITMHMAVRPD